MYAPYVAIVLNMLRIFTDLSYRVVTLHYLSAIYRRPTYRTVVHVPRININELNQAAVVHHMVLMTAQLHYSLIRRPILLCFTRFNIINAINLAQYAIKLLTAYTALSLLCLDVLVVNR